MYSFSEKTVLAGRIDAIWGVATDVARWAEWDPHEDASRIDGPFAAGTTGWVKPKGAPAGPFTITEVDEGRSWTSRASIPFGYLQGRRTYTPVADGRVEVSETIEVHGPFVPLFRLIWVRGMRADLPRTLAALGEEAARRG